MSANANVSSETKVNLKNFEHDVHDLHKRVAEHNKNAAREEHISFVCVLSAEWTNTAVQAVSSNHAALGMSMAGLMDDNRDIIKPLMRIAVEMLSENGNNEEEEF